MDESILDFLKRHLRAAGAHRWETIAAEAGCAKSLPRKIVYDDREKNGPGVLTVQPLVTYFQQVERGERQLPEPTKSEASTFPAAQSVEVEHPAAALTPSEIVHKLRSEGPEALDPETVIAPKRADDRPGRARGERGGC